MLLEELSQLWSIRVWTGFTTQALLIKVYLYYIQYCQIVHCSSHICLMDHEGSDNGAGLAYGNLFRGSKKILIVA